MKSELSFGGGTTGPPRRTRYVVAALAAHSLARAALRALLAGAVVMYLGSFFGAMAGAFFSDLRQSGWPFRVLTWCGWFEGRHFGALLGYVSALSLVWAILGLPLWVRLIGRSPDQIYTEAAEGVFAPPYPGQRYSSWIAGILFIPFIPVAIAVFAGFFLIDLVIFMILFAGLVRIWRAGGRQYLLTRLAVSAGIRDAARRRLW